MNATPRQLDALLSIVGLAEDGSCTCEGSGHRGFNGHAVDCPVHIMRAEFRAVGRLLDRLRKSPRKS